MDIYSISADIYVPERRTRLGLSPITPAKISSESGSDLLIPMLAISRDGMSLCMRFVWPSSLACIVSS